MSDYGFATYDEKSGRRKNVVNSKWPIFGPKYKDIKRAFKTIHITDTKQYNPNSMSASSVVLPTEPEGSQNGYFANVMEDEPIVVIPHGYGKRPLGYATISGAFSKNTRCVWDYTNYRDDFGDFPPSAKLEGVGTINGSMIKGAGGKIQEVGEEYVITDIFYENWWEGTGTSPIITYPQSDENAYLWLTENTFTIPGDNSSIPDADRWSSNTGKYRPPYTIKIDDTNVYVYRHYYWCDVYKRNWYIYNNRGYDLRARIKGVIDYAGSDFDLTIYLCPYSMEDLI